MTTSISKFAAVLAVVMSLFASQGCMKLQRAVGCADPGVFGCRDDPSPAVNAEEEIVQVPAVATGRESPRPRDETDQPWVKLINACMADGGQRTQCIENLPPDILAQLEEWEAGNAAMRRMQLERRAANP